LSAFVFCILLGFQSFAEDMTLTNKKYTNVNKYYHKSFAEKLAQQKLVNVEIKIYKPSSCYRQDRLQVSSLSLQIGQVRASDIPCYPSSPDRHLSPCCLVDSKGSHLCRFLHIPRSLGGTLGPLHNVVLRRFALLIVVSPKHVDQYVINHLEKMLWV
jgi:hypothetical protein